jgi:hypothetical protein
LWRALVQITYTRPLRRTILQLLQMRRTLARTFMAPTVNYPETLPNHQIYREGRHPCNPRERDAAGVPLMNAAVRREAISKFARRPIDKKLALVSWLCENTPKSDELPAGFWLTSMV